MKKITDYFNKIILAGVVYAAVEDIPLRAPTGFGALERMTPGDIISTVIKLILIVAAVIAFIFLVAGGIKWITSGGDKEGTQAAQKTLTAALIGLLIVFAAWAIMQLLSRFFGIEILSELKIPQIVPTGPTPGI